MLAVVLFALVAGTVYNTFGPRRIPWQQDWAGHVEAQAFREKIAMVNAPDARALLATAVVLDARPVFDYQRGHLPGARSLPGELVREEFFNVLGGVSPAKTLLVYCTDVTCDEALNLARFLRQQGYTNTTLFAGGMREWKKMNYPVVTP